MGPAWGKLLSLLAEWIEGVSEGEGISTVACDRRRWRQLATVRRYVLERCMERASPGHSYGCAPQRVSWLWTGVSEAGLMAQSGVELRGLEMTLDMA